jgi:hypothetical protein
MKTPQEDCKAAIVSDGWRQLAEAVRDEQDSKKLRQLVEQLDRELKEHTASLRPPSMELPE